MAQSFLSLTNGVCFRAIDKRALEVLSLRDQVEYALWHEMTKCWFPVVVDPSGGYVENLDRFWRPTGDRRRSLIFQSRIAWSAATYAAFDESARDRYSAYAEHGIKFINCIFRDFEHGGFFFDVDTNGRCLRGGEKHALGISFAVFAAAKTHAVTGSPQSLELAKDGFDWLQEHCRDAAGGGYIEETRRDGAPFSVGRPGRRNPLGLPYDRKTSNVHIHLLEAFIELYRACGEARVRDALSELLVLFCERFVTTRGALIEALDMPPPTGRQEQYGHTIETAHLLLEAVQTLFEGDDRTEVRAVNATARRMADHVLDCARDESFGGIYHCRKTNGRAKIWWAQAEALCAWAVLHRQERGQCERYRAALAEQWRFVLAHMIDARYGGWFACTSRRGSPRHPWAKASRAKACYHTTRALSETSRSLKEYPL